MTLDGVTAVYMRYFTELSSFWCPLRKSDWRYTDTFRDRNAGEEECSF